MSEPWTSDFRALRDHTRRGAPSLERTRQFVLASAKTPETEMEKEKSMSFIKRRPALAVAIALALIAVLTPVAYAVVNKVFLTVDPDQSEEEIERDVEQQLEKAGLSDPRVHAEKDGDRLEIGIRAEHQDGDLPELDIAVKGKEGGQAESEQSKVAISVECDLSQEQIDALTDVVGGHEFTSLIHPRAADMTDAQLAAALRDLLARHGFEAEVTVSGDDVSVVVKGPGAPSSKVHAGVHLAPASR
jgi:hypothetical protein